MIENIGSLLSLFKDKFFFLLFGLLTASGIFLFSPDSMLQKIGLNNLLDKNREIIGVLFIIFLSISVVSVFGFFIPKIDKLFGRNRANRTLRTHLKELTREEKDFLKPYIEENKNSIEANLSSGVRGGLEGKGIIYQASSITSGFYLPYNLQPFARNYLTKHPELLE